MKIYLDVIFLENLCMNFIILLATGAILKEEIKYIRIFFSSLIGGAYSIVFMLNILQIYSNVGLKIILSVVMIYLAFNSKTLKRMLKQLIIFYLTSFTFGGITFAFLYFIRPQDILTRNGIYVGTYPIKIALLGGVVGFVILNISFKLIKHKLSKKDMFCDIEIVMNNKIAKTKAMIDTGNLLKEPISGMPVVVVETIVLEKILPFEIINNLEEILKGNENKLLNQEIMNEYISKFRVIPFSSLGKQNGLLLGIKVDKVIIEVEEIDKVIENICVRNI